MKIVDTSSVDVAKNKTLLRGFIREASEAFLVQNSILGKIQRAELSKEEWRAFAIQRYLAAIPFEDLLRAGIQQSEKQRYMELATALKKNLQDEMGVDDQGMVNDGLAHSTWRRDFYTRLGIQTEELESAVEADGTKVYRLALEEMINTDDPLIIAGALLVLEATIPVEFRKMSHGRDKTFHEEFVASDQDDASTRQTKEKARLYLDDHVYHDATSHFPDLLRALEISLRTEEERDRVRSGAQRIMMAKKAFYDDTVTSM
jgi:pyrroloquinoline quinone (PQQ) biosynthesis protein C